MKHKMKGVLGVGLALVLVLSLMTAFVPANTAQAEGYTANRWNAMPIPSVGGAILATGINITDFAVASDGTTIYAVGGTDGVAKSTNGGRTFSWLTYKAGVCADLVAVAPDDPGTVAVVDVDADRVYTSKTGGATWVDLKVPCAATEVISDIAVSPARAGTILDRDYVVTTYDTGGWGDIYVVGSSLDWWGIASEQGLQYDFTSLALAPNWVGERVVIAVGSNATPAGNAEVGAIGDTYLVSISANSLSKGLRGPGEVNLDTGGNDSPGAVFSSLLLTKDGTVEWSAAQAHHGSYSVELTAPSGGSAKAGVWYGETLQTLIDTGMGNIHFHFYQTDAAQRPAARLFLDTTDDGAIDTVLIAGFQDHDITTSPIAINTWLETQWRDPADVTWDKFTGGPNYGDKEEVSRLADESALADATVMYVGYTYDSFAAPAYVDDITIGGVTYDLEPGGIVSSSVALPSDFDSTSVGNFRAFIGWTSTPEGGIIKNADDVYRVDWSSPRKLEIRSAVTIESVSYSGTAQEGTLFAGERTPEPGHSPGVWFTSNPMAGMPTWGFSYKPPTGAEKCKLQVAPDFATSNAVYGMSQGAKYALSKSEDGGLSFNGISLIDATITTITDVMPTPDGSYIFMATADGSLWRCPGVPAGGKWDRVGLATTFNDSFIRISPDADAVYWFDKGGKSILKSTNDGQMWSGRTAAADVADATVESQDILYIISGNNVFKSTSGAWSFGGPTDAGKSTLYSIAMAPSYPQEPVAGNVVVGAVGGGVALSTDSAATFASLKSVSGGENIQVCADEGYADNSIVYAASAKAGQGIYRYVAGVSAAWEQIREVTGSMSGLAMEGGLLYGSWAAGTGVVNASSFTITATLGGAASTISVSVGSVLATPSGSATVGGGPILTPVTITPGMGVVDLSIGLLAAGKPATILVEALTADSSGTWVQGKTTTTAAMTTGLGVVATNGGAWNLADVAVADGAASGVERGLLPTLPAPLCGVFDTMDVGAAAASFNTAPSAMRVCGTATDTWLYAIDAPKTLLGYSDTMAKVTVEVSAPAKVGSDAASGKNASFGISWTQISNATAYDVDTYADAACTAKVGPFSFKGYGPADPTAPTISFPSGTVGGGKYYVKVRACDQVPKDAIRSYWSEVKCYQVEAGLPVSVPYGGPQLLSPVPGATGASLSPGFGWGAFHGATKYEFELSTDPGTTARGYFVDALVGLTGDNALVTTAWQCDIALDYSTNYYWHVKAITKTGESVWSTGVFTTMAEAEVPAPPAPPVELPAPITPGWIWAIVAIGAVLVIVVIVLIFVTRRQ